MTHHTRRELFGALVGIAIAAAVLAAAAWIAIRL